VIEISDEIRARNIDIAWAFAAGVKHVSDKMLNASALAGCKLIYFGVESGSREVMGKISAKAEFESTLRAFELTKKAGIAASALLMVGNPGESDKSIRKTIELLRIIKPYSLTVQILTVFPGNKTYEDLKLSGFINDEYWLSEFPGKYYTGEHSLRKLVEWALTLRCYTIDEPVRSCIVKVWAFLIIAENAFGVRLISSPFLRKIKRHFLDRFIFREKETKSFSLS